MKVSQHIQAPEDVKWNILLLYLAKLRLQISEMDAAEQTIEEPMIETVININLYLDHL